MALDRTLLASLPFSSDDSQIIVGDSLSVLRKMKGGTYQTCVTSPPYWGLRDYGISGQIGAEPNIEEYLGHLVAVFREVRRVLASTGTLWLNIGDGYTSGGRTWRQADRKNPARGMGYRPKTPEGLKSKDLLGIPWRLAFALQSDGWYLRSDIIWNKPNAQPESVKDRPSRSHEYLFLLSKSQDYYYDGEAIKELSKKSGLLRNKRTVWDVNTQSFPEAHFATFPTALVEPCIIAGTKESDRVLDPFFGAGTVGVVCTGLGRHFDGIELNEDYADIARKRLGWI